MENQESDHGHESDHDNEPIPSTSRAIQTSPPINTDHDYERIPSTSRAFQTSSPINTDHDYERIPSTSRAFQRSSPINTEQDERGLPKAAFFKPLGFVVKYESRSPLECEDLVINMDECDNQRERNTPESTQAADGEREQSPAGELPENNLDILAAVVEEVYRAEELGPNENDQQQENDAPADDPAGSHDDSELASTSPGSLDSSIIEVAVPRKPTPELIEIQDDNSQEWNEEEPHGDVNEGEEVHHEDWEYAQQEPHGDVNEGEEVQPEHWEYVQAEPHGDVNEGEEVQPEHWEYVQQEPHGDVNEAEEVQEEANAYEVNPVVTGEDRNTPEESGAISPIEPIGSPVPGNSQDQENGQGAPPPLPASQPTADAFNLPFVDPTAFQSFAVFVSPYGSGRQASVVASPTLIRSGFSFNMNLVCGGQQAESFQMAANINPQVFVPVPEMQQTVPQEACAPTGAQSPAGFASFPNSSPSASMERPSSSSYATAHETVATFEPSRMEQSAPNAITMPQASSTPESEVSPPTHSPQLGVNNNSSTDQEQPITPQPEPLPGPSTDNQEANATEEIIIPRRIRKLKRVQRKRGRPLRPSGMCCPCAELGAPLNTRSVPEQQSEEPAESSPKECPCLAKKPKKQDPSCVIS